MAAWLPALKAALPIVSKIVSEAIPAFTSRKTSRAESDLAARQIAELQEAVTRNAQSLKDLASQLQKTIATLDDGANELDRKIEGSLETLRKQALDTASQQDAIAGLSSRIAVLEAQAAELRNQLNAARRNGLIAAGLAVLLAVAAIAIALSLTVG